MIELIQFIIFGYSEIAQHLPNLHFSSLDLLDCSDDKRKHHVYVLLIEVLEFEMRCFWLCQDEKMIISNKCEFGNRYDDGDVLSPFCRKLVDDQKGQ